MAAHLLRRSAGRMPPKGGQGGLQGFLGEDRQSLSDVVSWEHSTPTPDPIAALVREARMTGDQPTTYDELPYSNYCNSATHPDNLATLGTLFGLAPPAVDRGRVLELGCAGGGNLIPMAQA